MFKSPEGEKDIHAYHTPIEQTVQEKMSSFNDLVEAQHVASLFLFVATVVALVWASTDGIKEYYQTFTHFTFGLQLGTSIFKMPLNEFVNDFLLTIFFFIIGLEIKKEFLVGDLADPKKSINVLMAALGGMLIPALLYYAFNTHYPDLRGWGIPMATDTAFAVGILSLFKNRIRRSALVFMTALAIVDDIGAILVLAIYYTDNVGVTPILVAIGLVFSLILLNLMGVRRALVYMVIGMVIWLLFEQAGIHGTIAGIIIAFCIPARPQKGPRFVLRRVTNLLNKFERNTQEPSHILDDEEQHELLQEIQTTVQKGTTPLQRWEHSLVTPVYILILPIFALTNAGINVSPQALQHALYDPISLGIIAGLFLGKPIGITLFSYLSEKIGLGELADDCTIKDVFSISLFAGIGFTMSLFIAIQSFSGSPALLNDAKVGIIVGSLCSVILGVGFLALRTKQSN